MMKYFTVAAALAVATFTTSLFAADVGVSVSVGQPGFYGRVDVGGYSQPRVIYLQPRMVEWVARDRAPIYLHVPPGYTRNQGNHCDEYDACGARVYFVVDSWYNNEYVAHYHEHHTEYNHDGDHYNNDHESNHRNNDHEDGHRDNDHGDEN